ncbi:type II secretion system F family protein [Klebsiella spallanzanii]|uniref:type II secretion system F family protein n=1 Tax=Klebsiella spallanzanii TaxID=2587528 RepID=UPI00116C22C2|nr:type II secretion system F family protein [Klebsiella spallanzanii]VUS64918.1 hypothetical protein SB6419_03901 [Klebsiella spallanzanii]
MIIIFSIILLLGAIQLYFAFRSTKQIKDKILSTNIIATQKRQNKRAFIDNILNVLTEQFRKLRVNLIGKNSELIVKNAVILTVSIIATSYVNFEYLKFNSIIVMSLTLVILIYMLYVNQINRNRKDFERDFAEALNIINSATRVGRPIMQGFEECVRVIDTDFGREFKRILMRLDIGDEPERVFIDSYKRYPYSEYFSFIITILINMKGGGQVSEVMTRLTMLISASKTLERKKVAMTAEARMSVKVLVIIPVFFFFFLKFVSPDNFDILIGTQAGKYILYYAVGSILTGLLIVWSMMNKVG